MNILFELNGAGLPSHLQLPLQQLSEGLNECPADIQGLVYPSPAKRALSQVNSHVQLRSMPPIERLMTKKILATMVDKSVFDITGDVAKIQTMIPESSSDVKELQINAINDIINSMKDIINKINNDGKPEEINYDLANCRFNIDLIGHASNLNVEAQQLALILNKLTCVYLSIDEANNAKAYYQERGIESVIKKYLDNNTGIISYVLVSLDHSQPNNYGYETIHANTVLAKPNTESTIKLGKVINL